MKKKFYGLMNDLIFHIIMQRCRKALIDLISAFLDLPPEEIRDCQVENPIIYSEAIDYKKIALDVRVTLNNEMSLDLEVQGKDQAFWIKRSLYYWGKTYSSLMQGDNYNLLRPAYHLSVLDFALFKDSPEFYSEYVIMNAKTYKPYTDLLSIRVMNLKNMDKAKDTPQEQKLLKWAKLFKAQSYEEFIEHSKGEEALEEMGILLAESLEDKKLREQAEAYELYLLEYNSDMADAREQGLAEGEAKGKAEGEAKGRAEGEAKGKAEGQSSMARLSAALLSAGRTDDIIRAAEDPKYRKQLLEEYAL